MHQQSTAINVFFLNQKVDFNFFKEKSKQKKQKEAVQVQPRHFFHFKNPNLQSKSPSYKAYLCNAPMSLLF